MNLAYEFDWSVLTQPQHLRWLLEGLGWTLFIGTASVVASLIAGALLASAQAVSGVVGVLGRAWGNLARNLPCLYWLLLLYAGLPALAGAAALPPGFSLLGFGVACAIAALVIDNATYVADALGDGMRAVSRDERHAALACGLSERQAAVVCVLPQALRYAAPALLNRSVHVVKNSALAMAIGVPELMWSAQQIESITFRGIEATAVISVAYLALGGVLSLVVRRVERRVRLPLVQGLA